MMKRPTPIDHEKSFEPFEMFFSTTDKLGIIKSGNSVFERLSGYSSQTLVGAPHNIIRHPDMPKAVFKLLWDTILAGKPICAYVKNMSADGSYYWVLASMFAIPDGFLSIRIKPQSPLFAAAKAVYAKALAEEKKHGMEASAKLLMQCLAEAGFQDYESFMTATLTAEVSEHLKFTQNNGLNIATLSDTSDAEEYKKLVKLLKANLSAQEDLSFVFQKTTTFSEVNATLSHAFKTILMSLKNLRSLSINMALSSNLLGRSAATLTVIADSFQKFASVIHSDVIRFEEASKLVQSTLKQCEFNLASALLQVKMVGFFLNEIVQSGNIKTEERIKLSMLSKLAFSAVQLATHGFRSAKEHLQVFRKQALETESAVAALEIVRQTGKVEATQIAGATESVDPYLRELHRFTTDIMTALRKVSLASEPVLKGVSSFSNEGVALAQRLSI
jgi:aerotaxis receptor